MKLELKHLAAYLPYGLKMIKKNEYHSEDWTSYRIVRLNGVAYSIDNSKEWFTCIAEYMDDPKAYCNYESLQFKPILRPLSDLTKPIEHNGERFVPIEIILNHLNGLGCIEFGYVAHESGIVFYNTDDKIQTTLMMIDFENTSYTEYHIMELLFSWHFDVFGLIGQNLAISLNTLIK